MMFLLCYACWMFILPTLCWTQNGPGYFITAPDLIRVGVAETVLVSLRNTRFHSIPFNVSLESFPKKDVIYAQQTIYLEVDEPRSVTLRIDPSRVPAVDEGVKQYVYLVAKSLSDNFPFQKETVILMSYKSGYVFIQTDKPIYTPNHDVKIRVISLNQTMRPSKMPIRLEIRNPQNLVVKLEESVKTETGFITETFRFPTHPLFGNWSVVAYYGHKHQQNTTVQFFVKEYILPTFSVKINPEKNYILPDTREVLTIISAHHVFGEPVHGTYYIKYSALSPSGELRYLTEEDGELDGLGKVIHRLETENLPYNWFEYNKDSRLHIQAFITERSSGLTESTNNTQVMIVSTPYIIKWDRTTRFFKKDLPFQVKADVFHANGRPASDIPVNVIAKATTTSGIMVFLTGEEQNGISEPSFKFSDRLGHVEYSLNVPADIAQINITLLTSVPGLPVYKTSFLVDPQLSPSGVSFLLARIHTDSITVGQPVQVDLMKTDDNEASTIHLIVVSGGQIVAHKTTMTANKHFVINMDVTFDMVPHARLVAYYINGQNQVIADSVWFDVDDRCDDYDFSISLPSSVLNQKHQPGQPLTLQVRGEPGTRVGLLAVDEAVYLLKDYHRLTGEKMFSEMAEYDLGCGPGGGLDMQTIFEDSGLTVITDADLVIDEREDESCAVSSRRNRRAMDRDTILANLYDDPTLQLYCNMAVTQHLTAGDKRSCKVRTSESALSQQMSLDDPRMVAYYNCCMKAKENRAPYGNIIMSTGSTVESLEVGRSGRMGGNGFIDPNTGPPDTHVRSAFPETWIFDEVEIGPYGIQNYRSTTPDSITTWRIQAVGVSSTHGMCVARGLPLRVQPDFFIIVHLPFSVVRLEQVEIVATIFNYYHQNLSVRVFLRGVEGVCSESKPGEYSQPLDFDINPQDSVTVKYNVIPLKIGEFPLEIMVVTRRGNDAVSKMLKVVPEGVEIERVIPIVLDPSGARRQSQIRAGRIGGNAIITSFQHDQIRNEAESRQNDSINLDPPPGFVPDSSSVSVSIRGLLMGGAITRVIEGLGNDWKIPLGDGDGEQAITLLAENVYVLSYLNKTDQLTEDVEGIVSEYITQGITNQLSHRREDGSFALRTNNNNIPSSTWLTAFVNKVFCQADKFSYVDPTISCSAINWLITNTQQPNGSFREFYRVRHDRGITGGLDGDVTMTAFVLISLLECGCDDVEGNHATAVASAKQYLEDQVSSLVRPYEMAILTYALALAGGTNVEEAVELLKGASTHNSERNIRYWAANASSLDPDNLPYWYIHSPSAISVESTAYALLALLKLGEVSYVHPIVNWLTEQRNYNDGFVSTQDTVIALQALSEYAIHTSGDEVSLECTITNDVDANYRHSVTIHSGNALIQQSFKVPNNGTLNVLTTGTGVGELEVKVKYHSISESQERCPFDVTINPRESRSDGDVNEPVSTQPEPSSRSRVGRQTGGSAVRGGHNGRGGSRASIGSRGRMDKQGSETNRARVRSGGHARVEAGPSGAKAGPEGTMRSGSRSKARVDAGSEGITGRRSEARGKVQPEGTNTGSRSRATVETGPEGTITDSRSRARMEVLVEPEDLGMMNDDTNTGSRVGTESGDKPTAAVNEIIFTTREGDSTTGIEPVAYSKIIETDSRGRIGFEPRSTESSSQERGRSKGDFVGDVNVCVQNIGGRTIDMAVIDVGLFSGFEPIRHSLDSILAVPGTLVQRYEITDRSVIFYVKRMLRNDLVCVRFSAIREFVVGKIQPVAVRVYDHYSPDQECISFYHPISPSVILTPACVAGICPSACSARDCTARYEDLYELICKDTDTFAYIVRLMRAHTSNGFEIYTMNVSSILKIGGNDLALQKSFHENPSQPVVREFWANVNCPKLDIGTKREYLVIGTGGLQYRTETGQISYKYILDDTFKFEDWPVGLRATKNRFAAQVDKLERLRTVMTRTHGRCGV